MWKKTKWTLQYKGYTIELEAHVNAICFSVFAEYVSAEGKRINYLACEDYVFQKSKTALELAKKTIIKAKSIVDQHLVLQAAIEEMVQEEETE